MSPTQDNCKSQFQLVADYQFILEWMSEISDKPKGAMCRQ